MPKKQSVGIGWCILKIECIFVRTGDHPNLEKLISAVTDSKYTHAATRLEIAGKKRLAESKLPAYRITDGDIYDSCPVFEVVELNVTEEQHQRAVEMALELTGLVYGVEDCITGGIRDVLGEKVARMLDGFDHKQAINCSGAMLLILRSIWSDFLTGVKSEQVTPAQAWQAVRELKARMEAEQDGQMV